MGLRTHCDLTDCPQSADGGFIRPRPKGWVEVITDDGDFTYCNKQHASIGLQAMAEAEKDDLSTSTARR